MSSKTVTKKSTGKKKPPVSLLAPRRKVEAPPTETTRLLAQILDGKQRPKKRSKSSLAAATKMKEGPSSLAEKSAQEAWSRLSAKTSANSASDDRPASAAFGAKKGLSQLPATSNSMLKRKRTSAVVSEKVTSKIPRAKKATTVVNKKNTNNKHGKENNTAKSTSTSSSLIAKRPISTLASNPYTSNNSANKSRSDALPQPLRSKIRVEPPPKPNDPKPTMNVDPALVDGPQKPSTPTIQVDTAKSCRKSSVGESVPSETSAHSHPEQEGREEQGEPPMDIQHEPSQNTNQNGLRSSINDDNQGQADADDTNPFKLGLSLPTSRSNAQRRKRTRSSLLGQNHQPPKDTKELEVLGAMLSSAASATTTIGSFPSHKAPMDAAHPTSVSLVTAATYDPRRDNGMCTSKPIRLLPPMKSLLAPKTGDGDKEVGKDGTVHNKPTRKAHNNDNFVRQNLRNSAGACRGARNKKTKSRKFDRYKKGNYYNNQKGGKWNNNNDNNDDSTQDRRPPQKETIQRAETFRAGVDPLDDYLDGVLQSKTSASSGGKPKATTTAASQNQQAEAPQCTRHQRPCKLLVVKKTATGNKGRKFYCCSMPRGEQCDHFQWADDTVEAAKIALLKNSSHSGFMARQVAAYTERFKKLTVPELREATKRRNLDSTGKKQQLLFRLSVWVRDELASVAPKEAESDEDTTDAPKADETVNNATLVDSTTLDISGLEADNDDENGDSDSDSNCTSSDDELEFFGSAPEKVDVSTRPLANVAEKGERQKEDEERDAPFSETKSVHSENSEEDAEVTPRNSIQAALFSLFGYKHIKKGQEWAIKRCLQKQKSLLVAPTGFGKSMCYVLPAHLMDGVCIVVSPLISLIQDQLRELPPRVPAATLSGSVTTAATAAIVDDIIRKRIKVLFVSPERLASASFQRLFQPKWNKETNTRERPFPPVSLLCVDEAHCLSQWGHNFRPSYLRLRSLMHKIAPQSVLAITATAGHQVIEDICRTLGIDQCDTVSPAEPSKCTNTEEGSAGVWTMKTDRENIDVKSFIVGSQELRLSMLVKLLKPSKPKASTNKSKAGDLEYAEGSLAQGSVIVYVWRQRDAEVVAESIQASGVSGGVVHYHGGMDSGARANAYSKFMRSKARICVATVAFGLGVNKPDIVGIIHMYLPASPENHLQEIGRAGRDGRAAQAIALIVEEEALVRHSQSHSDLVSRSQIRSLIFSFRKLVRQTIESIDCEHWSQVSAIGVAIPLKEFSAACDCKTETIETIFSLLELKENNPTPAVQVEGVTLDKVTISLKRRKIDALIAHEAVASVIQRCAVCVDAPAGEKKEDEDNPNEYAYERENSRRQQFNAYSFGSYRFSVAQCANMLGPAAQPRHVFAALRRLQSNGEIELTFDKTAAGTALRVVLNNSGIQMFHGSDDDGQQLEDLASSLTEGMNSIATASANKVLDINYIMHKVADVQKSTSTSTKDEDEDEEKSGEEDDDEVLDLDMAEKSASLARFQELTGQYFGCPQDETMTGEKPENLPCFVNKISEKDILIDAMSVVSDLAQYPNSGVDEDALQLGNPETSDYTALAVTKFLHGMATVRAPIATCRYHRLFGKWQAIRFGTLHSTIQKVLSHTK